jgi:hypothetical protein
VAAIPSGDDIVARKKFLGDVANLLIKGGALADSEVVFLDNRMKLIAEAYFLLNEAYKTWRIEKNHNTQPPKIAALTCLAILELQPFLPKDPKNAKSIQQAYANEMFALACALAILGVPLKKTTDTYLRLLDVLSECACETIQQYIVDRRANNDRELSTYKLRVNDKDKFAIDCLITVFEMLWLSKPKSKSRKRTSKKKPKR